MSTVLLDQVCQLRKGITKKRLEQPNGTLYGVFQITQINTINLDPPSETAMLDPIKTAPHALQPNQVLISLIGQHVQAGVVPDLNSPMVANANLAVLTPDAVRLDAHYLAALVRTTFFQARLTERITGSVLPHISLDALRKVEIPLPSLEIQRAIADGFLTLEIYRSTAQREFAFQESLLDAEVSQVLEVWA